MKGPEGILSPGAAVPAAQGPWAAEWFSAAVLATMEAWRCVESQTAISTLKVVDTMEEHESLESMLEDSKPPLPSGGDGLHYLLFTPFRYTSPTATRFRVAHDLGIWYGADSVQAVLAECAYWRMRFILDSVDLCKSSEPVVTSHTVYAADVQGTSIDLTNPPWSEGAEEWKNPTNCSATQALGREARRQGTDWIRYESIRNPGATCAAALGVAALSSTRPRESHDWVCSATRDKVIYYSREQGQRLSWDA